MTNPPPPTPAERFVAILRRLHSAVDTRRMFGPLPAPLPIVMLIMGRIRAIEQHIRRITDRIAAGTYKPRRSPAAPRRKPENPKPWQPSPLPTHFNWLEPLIPQAQQARAGLSHLFQDPEMLALIEAGPDALRRPLRSLCRMIGLKPPPILALPPRPPRPKPQPKPRPSPHRTDPPPGVPQWMLMAPPGKKLWFPDELYDSPESETT